MQSSPLLWTCLDQQSGHGSVLAFYIFQNVLPCTACHRFMILTDYYSSICSWHRKNIKGLLSGFFFNFNKVCTV